MEAEITTMTKFGIGYSKKRKRNLPAFDPWLSKIDKSSLKHRRLKGIRF
jgi:hypothetical protein